MFAFRMGKGPRRGGKCEQKSCRRKFVRTAGQKMPAERREKRTEAPQKKICSHRSPEIVRWEEKNANKRAAEEELFAWRADFRPPGGLIGEQKGRKSKICSLGGPKNTCGKAEKANKRGRKANKYVEGGDRAGYRVIKVDPHGYLGRRHRGEPIFGRVDS